MSGSAQNEYGLSRAPIRLVAAVENKQPQINPKLALLYASYDHDGLMLDLYGEYEKFDDQYIVQEVALAGTKVNLDSLVTQQLLNDMSAFCDRISGRDLDQERRDDADDARRELAAELAA